MLKNLVRLLRMTLGREALGDFGVVSGGYYLLVILLTSSTSPRVSYVCRVLHHKYARVDREFYSKDPIIAVVSPMFIIRAQVPYVNSYEGWYGSIPTSLSSRLFTHVYYTCADSAS